MRQVLFQKNRACHNVWMNRKGIREPLIKSHMAALGFFRDGMQGVRGSEWPIPFVSSPDTVRRSRLVREGLPAAAPAIGCCAVTCRSRSTTQQTARKNRAHAGCDKIARSRCRAPRCSGLDTVVRSTPVRERPLPPLSHQTAAPHRIVGASLGYDLRRAPCDHRDFVSNAAHGGLDQRFLRYICATIRF